MTMDMFSVVIINLLCYNDHGYVLSVVIINLLCYNDHGCVLSVVIIVIMTMDMFSLL